jgi:hypothetical protein
MEDWTKLATAVQNRPQVAKAVHQTIVTLTRPAQGQESEIEKKTFYEIIEGARATFGTKKQIHSGTHALSQAVEKHVPISANPGALERPLMAKKRSYTEGKALVKGPDVKADCDFCHQKGHKNIVSCKELKKYGEHIRSK